MSNIVILAGPQAAGKSTVVAKLSSQPYNVSALFSGAKTPLLFPLQESRQIIVHKYMLLGAIFMTLEHELEVVSCDLGRMDMILQRAQNHLIHLDECNIFTIAHAAAHGLTQVERYWDEYITRLRKLNAAVIFLDVPPDISWDRRRRQYQHRLLYFPEDQHEVILRQYQDYMIKLYPLLLDTYERLPIPKVIIDGRSSAENVISMVCQQMAHLIPGFG